tara:strand:+ start:18720 stop:18971 length:252 start_codon:yes stop_codon:yes gene_type:complete
MYVSACIQWGVFGSGCRRSRLHSSILGQVSRASIYVCYNNDNNYDDYDHNYYNYYNNDNHNYNNNDNNYNNHNNLRCGWKLSQ